MSTTESFCLLFNALSVGESIVDNRIPESALDSSSSEASTPELIHTLFDWPSSLSDWRWSYGVIPFHIHESLAKTDYVDVLVQAMKDWQVSSLEG